MSNPKCHPLGRDAWVRALLLRVSHGPTRPMARWKSHYTSAMNGGSDFDTQTQDKIDSGVTACRKTARFVPMRIAALRRVRHAQSAEDKSGDVLVARLDPGRACAGSSHILRDDTKAIAGCSCRGLIAGPSN